MMQQITPKAPADPWAKLTILQPNSGQLSVLLKGPSGGGKSHALLSFPDPILLVYADSNLETVRKLQAAGRRVHPVLLQSWTEYQSIIVPKLRTRSLMYGTEPFRTIGVDTYDAVTEHMWRDIQGTRGKLAIQDFGTGLSRQVDTTRDLVSLTQPQGEHPGYNVVFTCHIKDQTNEEGALLKITPAIMGQFSNQLEAFFDYVLLCQAEVTTKVVNQQAVKERQFKILTVPPNQFHTAKGGNLPPELVVPNNQSAYEVLQQHWAPPTQAETK